MNRGGVQSSKRFVPNLNFKNPMLVQYQTRRMSAVLFAQRG